MPTAKELAQAYYDGLKDAYYREGGQEVWDRFASVAQGASQEDCADKVARYSAWAEGLKD